MGFQIRRTSKTYLGFLVVTSLLLGAVFIKNTKAANTISVSVISQNCQDNEGFYMYLDISGNFDTADWNGNDAVGISVIDALGNNLSAGFRITLVPIGQSGLSTSLPLSITAANPLQIRVYEATYDGSNFIVTNTLLASTLYSSPCYPGGDGSQTTQTSSNSIDPVIAGERARGITRLFDDGIVVTQQPNGNLEYYLPNGCVIGMTPKETLDNTRLYLRFIVETISGCGGYTIHLWSLGFQACQMQLNIYGPNGFEKVYQLPRKTDFIEQNEAGCVRLTREEPNDTQQVPVSASPLWWQQIQILAKEIGKSTKQLIADIAGIGPLWEGWAAGLEIRDASKTADLFLNPSSRARLLDELYHCPGSSQNFRNKVDSGVVLSGLGNSWDDLTLEQKQNDVVWQNVFITTGGSGFVGPEFMRRWLGEAGCIK